MRVSRRTWLLLAGGVLAAGCANAEPPSASVSPPSAIVAAPSVSAAPSGQAASPETSPAGSSGASLKDSPFIGTYTVTIPDGGSAPPGTWKLFVAANGLAFVRPDGQKFSPGTLLAVTADSFTIGPDPGCPNQTATPGPGRYSWVLDAGTLTIKELDPPDTCRDRAATLTELPWKVPS